MIPLSCAVLLGHLSGMVDTYFSMWDPLKAKSTHLKILMCEGFILFLNLNSTNLVLKKTSNFSHLPFAVNVKYSSWYLIIHTSLILYLWLGGSSLQL